MAADPTIRFAVEDLIEQLEAFAARWPDAIADARGRIVSSSDDARAARLVPPLLAPALRDRETIGDYLGRCEAHEPSLDELHAIVLLRAGAAALGLWRGDELLQHKAIRKYVVRGKGHAQPTHLKTKGKSRYGSRLRLQNWKRLLTQANEWLTDAFEQEGQPDRVFYSVPVRVLVDLQRADPPPPFSVDDPDVLRIPMHVHRPDHAELLRVRKALRWGRVDLLED